MPYLARPGPVRCMKRSSIHTRLRAQCKRVSERQFLFPFALTPKNSYVLLPWTTLGFGRKTAKSELSPQVAMMTWWCLVFTRSLGPWWRRWRRRRQSSRQTWCKSWHADTKCRPSHVLRSVSSLDLLPGLCWAKYCFLISSGGKNLYSQLVVFICIKLVFVCTYRWKWVTSLPIKSGA